jgi:GTP cyclohydrolase I
VCDAHPVDPAAARAAIAALLRAVGAPVSTDPELAETPERVTEMLLHELLDGYRADVPALLRDGVATSEPGLVLLTDVRFTFVCPHHLLPSTGVAHVGYLPGPRVVGLGTIVKLVEAYAHRLVLQESLGQQIADALCAHLSARGAAVVIRGSHACLSARGPQQRDAAVITTAFAGTMADAASSDRGVFFSALGAFRAGYSPAG